MYYKIKGKPIIIDNSTIGIETASGITYECQTHKKTIDYISSVKEEDFIYNFYSILKISDYDQKIYVFLDKQEYSFYKNLSKISGSGRYSMELIGHFENIQEAKMAIFNKDEQALKKVKGLGGKSCTELINQYKFTKEEEAYLKNKDYTEESDIDNIINALKSLGMKKVNEDNLNIIKEMLSNKEEKSQIIQTIIKRG